MISPNCDCNGGISYSEKNLCGRISIVGGVVFDVEYGEKPFSFELLVPNDKGHELITLSASSSDEKIRWMECLAYYTKEDIRPSGMECFRMRFVVIPLHNFVSDLRRNSFLYGN